MKYRKCEICGLKTERKDGLKRFFMARFPLDEARCKQWVKYTGKEDLAYVPIEKLHQNKFICGKHFTAKDLKKKRTQLNKYAIPSIWLTATPLSDEILAEFPYHIHAGLDNVILHVFPNPVRQTDRFRSWVMAIGGGLWGLDDHKIYKYRRVCHNHFEPRFHTYSKRLSPDAVPTLCLSGKDEDNPIFKVPNTVVVKRAIKRDGSDDKSGPKKADDVADYEDPLLSYDDGSSDVEEDPEDFKACICCLTVAGDLREFDGRLRAAFDNVTGLESNSDDMPNSICVICIARLAKALAFKSQCTRAHNALTRAVEDTDQGWQSAVLSIKREELKLNFKLDFTVVLTEEIKTPFAAQVVPLPDFNCNEENVKTPNDSQEFDAYMDEDDFNHFDHRTDDVKEANDNTPLSPVRPEDLDMTDIFKDLKDESASELESLCDFKMEPKRKKAEVKVKIPSGLRRKKFKKLASVDYIGGKPWAKKASLALCTAHIRFMSLAEQRQAHIARLSTPTFLKALYKCAPCVETFKDKADLIQHVGFHQRMKEYKHMCNICKCRFKTSAELHQHSMMLHWYEFECKQCAQKHCDLTSLIACYERHKDTPWTVVTPTHATLAPTHSVIRKHFDKHQLSDSERTQPVRNPTLEYPCGQCSKAYSDRFNMLRHQRLHQPDERRKLKCDVCGIYLPTKRSIEQHYSVNHVYLYKCRHCSVDCSNRLQAGAHFKQFHNTEADSKKMSCYTCHERFDDAAEFKSHLRLHREHCSMCGQSTDSLRALYLHQLTHHAHIRLGIAELNDVSAHCAACSVYFADSQSYWTHSAKHHRRVPIDCDTGCRVCCEVYRTQDELRAHNCVLKDDRDECDYEPPAKTKKGLCADCGMTYTNYATHEAIHHNPHGKCKFCSQRHTNAKFMISHILATHTFKPFICNVCDLRFFQRKNCRNHILKIHTPETPFKCKWCARRFAHMDYLNQHLKNEHKNRAREEGAEITVPLRETGKLYTFPHMRIDVTLVPAELVRQATFYISDYTETKYTELGDGEKDQYLYVDRNLDPNVPTHDVDGRKKSNKRKALRMKLLRRKRRLQFSNSADYTRRATELAVKSIDQLTEGKGGDNPAAATHDGTGIVYADAVKMKDAKPKKTVMFEPARVYAEENMKADVQYERVDEEMQHIGEVAHVGEEIADVGEVVPVGEEVLHEEEVKSVVGQLVEHDGRTYVLVGGAYYELES